MDETADIAIVGAGAAGLAAAIFCADAAPEGSRRGVGMSSAGLGIVVLDGAVRIGAKILVSGGGRCNVTHDSIRPEDFQGSRNVVKNILREFDEKQTVEWFRSLGVELKCEETGKLFPVSDDAHTVLDALLRRCGELGVEVRTQHRVHEIVRVGEGFAIHHEQGRLQAGRVVMATGGRSLPKTGSDGLGWEIVKKLGHTVTPTYPALVPLVLDETFIHAGLSGISHEAELSTFVDGKLLDRRSGSLLWTHLGISGPVVMDASRFWVIAHTQGREAELRCSFLPGRTFEQAQGWLIEAAAAWARRSVEKRLAEQLPQRVAQALCAYAGIPRDQELGQLTREGRRKLVHVLTGLELPVVRDRGWNYAEVTAGGVPLGEVDPRTLHSRIVPGLYLVGEMLDCEGRIGGFNFQWAWATGYVAGKALGRSCAKEAER